MNELVHSFIVGVEDPFGIRLLSVGTWRTFEAKRRSRSRRMIEWCKKIT